MHSVPLSEQTRLQVERAQRAAEEARERIRASRGGSLRLDPDRHRNVEDELLDDERARDVCGD